MTTSSRSSSSWFGQAWWFALQTMRVVEIAVYLAVYDLLYLIGMKWLWRLLRRCRNGAAPPSSDAVGRLVRAVEIASALYVKRVRCLQRAFVTTWYLRRRGYACVLVVGAHVARKEGHAWVETGDHVLGDPRHLRRFFRPLSRA